MPLTVEQRQANTAASYVREYLRRGAIAPPDLCDRCENGVQISPAHPLRKLRPWHPDPAQRTRVAWLCSECHKMARSTREPLMLTWTWPGLSAARSRKPPKLAELAATLTFAIDEKFSNAAFPSLRDSALIGSIMTALQPGERERLYGAGAKEGPTWQPTGDPLLDRLIRAWIFNERAGRGSLARAEGGIEVVPVPLPPRRCHGARFAPSVDAPTPRQPFDEQATQAAIERALAELERANATADETNARVTEALRSRSR